MTFVRTMATKEDCDRDKRDAAGVRHLSERSGVKGALRRLCQATLSRLMGRSRFGGRGRATIPYCAAPRFNDTL